MKTASAALINILNGSAPILRADLYTFTLKSGSVLRFTSADVNLVVGGFTFISGPVFKRGGTKQKIGLAVDTVGVELFDDNRTLIAGTPIIQQFRLGLFDTCLVSIEKLFLLTWTDTSPGTIPWFTGRIGPVATQKMTAQFTVNSITELLTQQMPQYVYQPSCVNTWANAGCTVVATTYSFSYTAATGSTASAFNLTGTAKADGYYALGKIKFTAGANAGQSRTIKSYISGVATTFNAFPFIPAIGDACTLSAGCNKLNATCGTNFSNLPKFRGYRWIPVPETAIQGGSVQSSTTSAGYTGQPPIGSSGSAGSGHGTYVP